MVVIMPEAYYKDLGTRIARARTNAGLTQTELAQKLNRERSSIANMEAGRQRCLAGALIDIAWLLRVDPAWLLLGSDGGLPVPPTVISPKAVVRQADELMRIAADLYRVDRDLRELADKATEPIPDSHVDMEAT